MHSRRAARVKYSNVTLSWVSRKIEKWGRQKIFSPSHDNWMDWWRGRAHNYDGVRCNMWCPYWIYMLDITRATTYGAQWNYACPCLLNLCSRIYICIHVVMWVHIATYLCCVYHYICCFFIIFMCIFWLHFFVSYGVMLCWQRSTLFDFHSIWWFVFAWIVSAVSGQRAMENEISQGYSMGRWNEFWVDARAVLKSLLVVRTVETRAPSCTLIRLVICMLNYCTCTGYSFVRYSHNLFASEQTLPQLHCSDPPSVP